MNSKWLRAFGIVTFRSGPFAWNSVFKAQPVDFIVREVLNGRRAEISDNLTKQNITGSGNFRFILEKTDRDWLSVLKEVEKHLGRKLQYYGTKDKIGVTSQFVSVSETSEEAILELNSITGLRVGNVEVSKDNFVIGGHDGNYFEIRLRGGNANVTDLDVISSMGFVNYFGEQRFGKAEGVRSDYLGQLFLQKNYNEIFRHFMTILETDHTCLKEAKACFLTNGDYEQSIKLLKVSRKTRAASMLYALKNTDGNADEAIRKVPWRLRKLWVQAFAARLWNQEISMLLASGNFEEEVDILGHRCTSRYASQLQSLEIAEKSLKGIKGGSRKVIAFPKNLSWMCENDSILLTFELEKGSYASMLCRELILAE